MDARSDFRLLLVPERRPSAGHRRARERDERAGFGRIHGLREVEALRVRAAQLAQPLHLLRGLDALDDDALAQVLGEGNDRRENVRAARD